MVSPMCHILLRHLVAVSQSTHAAHDTEDVVVDGIHAEVVRVSLAGECTCSARLAVIDQSSGVNAREVASARWLVFLGADGKGIHVDWVRSWVRNYSRLGGCNHSAVCTSCVVLVGLDLPEVVAISLIESVLTVELDTSTVDNIIVGEWASERNAVWEGAV